jgi:hypothetical protein
MLLQKKLPLICYPEVWKESTMTFVHCVYRFPFDSFLESLRSKVCITDILVEQCNKLMPLIV